MKKNKLTYLVNLLLGSSTAGLTVFGIGVLNGWWLQNTWSNAIGAAFTLGIIAIALAILLISNLIFTVVNIKQHAPPLAYFFAWAPFYWRLQY